MTHVRHRFVTALCLLLVLAACGEAGMEDATSQESVDSQSGDGAERDLEVRNNALLSEDRGFLPHHDERDVWVGGCLLRVAHGNYIFTAYAKVKTFTEGCVVQPVVHALVNGRWLSRPGSTAFSPGVWAQAEYPYGSIILSEYRVRGYTPVTFAALR